jgi:hypothetical protein
MEFGGVVLISLDGSTMEVLSAAEAGAVGPEPVCGIFGDFTGVPSADFFLLLTPAEFDACELSLLKIAEEDGALCQ